jgi:hypothetical protein
LVFTVLSFFGCYLARQGNKPDITTFPKAWPMPSGINDVSKTQKPSFKHTFQSVSLPQIAKAWFLRNSEVGFGSRTPLKMSLLPHSRGFATEQVTFYAIAPNR